MAEEDLEIEKDPNKKRYKSTYSGVPKIEKILNTRVKLTESGIHVFNEGQLMDELNRFSAGAEFGDLALKEQGGLRQTTGVAALDTHLMVLSKSAYDKIIGEQKKRTDTRIINFLREIYYFDRVHPRILQAFMVNKTIEVYTIRDIIFDMRKPLDRIFVVIEGQVTLVRKKQVFEDPEEQEVKNIFRIIDGEVKNDPNHLQKIRKHQEMEQICLREEGQSFAEEFVVLSLLPDYKAVASSTKVVVASIKGEDLRKKIFQFMPSCYRDFEYLIREKRETGYVWKKNIQKILDMQLESDKLEKSEDLQPQSKSKLLQSFLQPRSLSSSFLVKSEQQTERSGSCAANVFLKYS